MVLLLLQRRRGRDRRRECDAVEVGDEGLPTPSEGSVQDLMEEKRVNRQIPSGSLNGGKNLSKSVFDVSGMTNPAKSHYLTDLSWLGHYKMCK